MIMVKAEPGQQINLGFQGENLARAVSIDFSDWAAGFGSGDLHVVYIPPGSDAGYLQTVSISGTTAIWTITGVVTQRYGVGWLLWSYHRASDGLIVKTCKTPTLVVASPDMSGSPPPIPPDDWLARIMAALENLTERVDALERGGGGSAAKFGSAVFGTARYS